MDVSFASSQARRGMSPAALTNAEYLRQSCAQMRIGVGPRDHVECPHRVTFDRFSPSDGEALRECIDAAYRQVLGNAHVMAYERCDSLEAEFADGRLCAREFVRHLAKSALYKSRYFFKVSAYRGIELNFKHLLGRPPLDQQEIISSAAIQSEHGFDGLIDSIIDSAEYTEVFGDHTIPYVRSFTSASGMTMQNFVRIAALEQGFASSDRSKGSDSLLHSNLAGGVSMAIHVPPAPEYVQMSAAWLGGKPPANYEKLWRGLALVGGAHLAGMLVNVVSQMLGIHALDRIPAMFLGL
jgi:phycoerythrin-associated linker protein